MARWIIQLHSLGWSSWLSWLGGVGHGGQRGTREGKVILVLIPLLMAPIFVAIVVFVFVEEGVNDG